MRRLILLFSLALLLGSCSDNGTDSGEEFVLFTGDAIPVQSMAMITVINNTGDTVYGNGCPGFIGEKLENGTWVEVWRQIDDCINVFVEPYEFTPGCSICMRSGPTLMEPGIYRVAIESWRNGDSLNVTTVYSRPFSVYEE